MTEPNSPNSCIAGIILAAGASSRMGQPKMLLTWKGDPLIRHAARTALAGGLNPIIVVTGASGEAVQSALDGLDVQIVHNPNWMSGQSTSVRAGIGALPAQADAVIILLGDQPYLSSALLQALCTYYDQYHPKILAPTVGGQRSNPVLFDHSIFPFMLSLEGDTGARSLFARFPPTLFPWDDEHLPFDIDTPEDYGKLTTGIKNLRSRK